MRRAALFYEHRPRLLVALRVRRSGFLPRQPEPAEHAREVRRVHCPSAPASPGRAPAASTRAGRGAPYRDRQARGRQVRLPRPRSASARGVPCGGRGGPPVLRRCSAPPHRAAPGAPYPPDALPRPGSSPRAHWRSHTAAMLLAGAARAKLTSAQLRADRNSCNHHHRPAPAPAPAPARDRESREAANRKPKTSQISRSAVSPATIVHFCGGSSTMCRC